MAKPLTAKQIEWAKSHDWFHSELPDGAIFVIDSYTVNGGPHQTDVLLWDKSFSELRAWAGY